MKNLQCQCEHPAIILNPNLKDIILKYGNYHLNGRSYTVSLHEHSKYYLDFPYKKFGYIKRSLNSVELSNYYVVDSAGEHIPMFYAVGCGKCAICRDKKANEWSTRAMCESQTSCSPPIFFTLTYNDICLPSNGVRKGACQRFMKRLRINLNRYMKCKCNIRYFMCAEYGTKTKRPHYHGILWNLPLLEPKHLTYLIQKSWSFDVTKKFWDTIPSTLDKYNQPVYKYYDDKDKRYRVLYGYTTNSVCTEGRVRYAMKYMRKDGEVPHGKRTLFYLASRRGGIGSEWITSKLNEYRNNPSLLNVSLTDVWSGVKYDGVLPRYFKDKIAPSPSKLVPKEIRDNFKLWNYLSNKFHTFIGFDYTPNKRVIEHYPSLYYHQCRIYDGTSRVMLKSNNTDIDSFTRDKAKLIEYLEWKLLNYDYDVSLARSVPVYKRKHLQCVERFIQSQPVVDIPDKVYQLNRARVRRSYSECF